MAKSLEASPQNFLIAALASLRFALLGLGSTSAVINILALTGSFFMLQVYDRVIPGRSVPTLVTLCIIAAVLYVFQGLLELIRSILLARVGAAVDEQFGAAVFQSLLLQTPRPTNSGDGLQLVRDMDNVRGFLSGPGPTALFDLPWMPFYLGMCFLFHVWIGATALAGAVLLVGLTMIAELKSKKPAAIATRIASERNALAEASHRNSETIMSMGFGDAIGERWTIINRRYLANHLHASTVTAGLSTLSRVVRMMLQSGVLAVGAVLVIRQEATGGIMIASSILVSRALAPVELAIGHWKGFAAARSSWARLNDLALIKNEEEQKLELPPPCQSLRVDNLYLAPPGFRSATVCGVSFIVKAGEAVGIIGPSASGKSSLARGLVGVWPPMSGMVRLDHASIAQWTQKSLGQHIGYLPQDVSLLDGSIADNIARFEDDAPPQKVIAAARAAGIYDMIVQLPEGFETKVGDRGSALSAGQRQRIALARALYGDPFLVVLDEPNSNLDADGETALTNAILGVRSRMGVVIVIAHRPSALSAVDTVLILANGRQQAFQPKADILGRPARATPSEPVSARPVLAGEVAAE